MFNVKSKKRSQNDACNILTMTLELAHTRTAGYQTKQPCTSPAPPITTVLQAALPNVQYQYVTTTTN